MGLVGGSKLQALHLIGFVIPANSSEADFEHLHDLCRLMRDEGSLLLQFVSECEITNITVFLI